MNPAALAEPVAQPGAEAVSGDVQVKASADRALGSLEQMADIPLTIAFELARSSITAAQLLELTQGAVVPLGPVDVDTVTIRVDGDRVGAGEITLCGDRFGIRVSGFGESRAEDAD